MWKTLRFREENHGRNVHYIKMEIQYAYMELVTLLERDKKDLEESEKDKELWRKRKPVHHSLCRSVPMCSEIGLYIEKHVRGGLNKLIRWQASFH